MKFSRDIMKSFSAGIEKIFWFFGLHAFSLILFFVVIDLILGAIVFYNNVLLAGQVQPKVTQSVIKFDDKTYQDVMSQLQSREQTNP